MPRKLRPAKRRRGEGTIKPCVLLFLETGDLSEAERENGWIAFSLTSADARSARDAWLAGDEFEARALLALCPGARNLFVPGGVQ